MFLWSYNSSVGYCKNNMEVYIMVIETNRVNGALIVYAIINGYLEKQMYIGYSKRDAVKAFKQRYNLK